jgi:hypothetical protein
MEIVFQQFSAVRRSAGFTQLPLELHEALDKAHTAWWKARGGRG